MFCRFVRISSSFSFSFSDAVVRHLGLRSHKPSNQRNPPKRSLPPQKCITGQHKVPSEEGEKLTSRTISSHPQDSFFSTLEWLDDPNPQDASQNITESIQNNSQNCNIRQPSEHATHLSSSVCACFYNL